MKYFIVAEYTDVRCEINFIQEQIILFPFHDAIFESNSFTFHIFLNFRDSNLQRI